MKKGIVLCTVTCLIAFMSGDIPDTSWTRTFGGANNDWSMDVKQTSDKGYVITGFTFSFGDGYYQSDDFNSYPSSVHYSPPYEPLNGHGNWSSVGWDVMHEEIVFDSNYTMVRNHGTGSNNHATYHLSTLDTITTLTVGFKYTEQRNADLTVYISPDNTNWTEVTNRFGLRMEPSITDVFDDLSSFTSGYGHDAYIRFKTHYWSGNYWMDEIDDFWVTGVKAKAYLIKTDAGGNLVWQETYGIAGSVYGYSVMSTDDGGYIVAGRAYLDGTGDCDAWLLKTDANGNTIWAKTYGGSGRDYGYSVDCTSDGGYIIGGVTTTSGAGGADFWLLKTDENGDTLWTKTYGGTNNDYGYSVKQTEDAGYVIVGATYSYGAGNNDAWLIRTDADGNALWAKTYGGIGWNECYAVQQTSDDGFIIAGKSYYDDAPFSDQGWLLKTDADGNFQWQREHGPAGSQGYRSVQQTIDDGYITAGYAYDVDAWGGRVYITKTDVSGDALWTVTYGGPRTSGGYAVQQTSDGGYIVAGITNSTGEGEYDVYLIKLAGILIQATIDIDPDVLNDKSQGRWVTCYIELPEAYSAEDIDATTVEMTEADGEAFDPSLPSEGPFGIGDYDEDGIPDLMVKFDRQELIAQLTEMGIMSDVELTVHGELYDGTEFEGYDTILFLRKAQSSGHYGEQALQEIPADFMIVGCEPNPFNARTTITYAIPSISDVMLSIYDVNGRLVNTLVDKRLHAGYYTVLWDGVSGQGELLPNGIYFLKFAAGDYSVTQKLLFVK